jgi:hypothetical protein
MQPPLTFLQILAFSDENNMAVFTTKTQRHQDSMKSAIWKASPSICCKRFGVLETVFVLAAVIGRAAARKAARNY